MKYLIRTLLLLILAGFGVGFYYKWKEPAPVGDQIIGISVLVMSFILMPLFIYHRSKGKNIKDYMFTQENWDKMNGKKDDSSENQ